MRQHTNEGGFLMWERSGLIGNTGFVGGALARQIAFAQAYNSRTIERIRGECFGTLVCAGAPAAMWAANQNPHADQENLYRLASEIDRSTADRVILISTIAVFDGVSQGYTENDAYYETAKAYGKNRRDLELHFLERPGSFIIRLPALFGPGLKKNFIFDIINPIPSFVKPEKYQAIHATFTPEERRLADRFFAFDGIVQMCKLDRDALQASGARNELEQAFDRAGFLAASFTNSDSEFQFYNVANLRRDIETCVSKNIKVLNICSEPLRADALHPALTRRPFSNPRPPIVKENVRTIHADAFGRTGSYLFDSGEVMRDLRKFVARPS